MKRRRRKIGPAEIEIVDGTAQADGESPSRATDVFERAPGSFVDSPTTSVVPEPEKSTLSESRALWNQPIQRQLVFLPAAAAFVWWKWFGFSGWSWLVVVVAIPPTVLYVRSVRRATDPDVDAPHELPPLPSNRQGNETRHGGAASIQSSGPASD